MRNGNNGHAIAMLPQAPDAEKAILSSMLLAPREVFDLCARRNLGPDAFYVPAHATLFNAITDLIIAGKPVDFVTLGYHLGGVEGLSKVGGPVFLNELFVMLPTAANAAAYLDEVMEMATRRSLLGLSREIEHRIEAGHGVPDIAEFVRTAASKVGTDTDAVHELNALRFNFAAAPAESAPVYGLGDHVIATVGNLLAVQAQAKAGKTALLGALMASAMSPSGDCLGVVSTNHGGRGLIHFDTEQSRFHHDLVVRRALLRAGASEPPGWLRSYCVTGMTLPERKWALQFELERTTRIHGGVHSCIIDGIGDFCADPNDSAEAFALIDELHRLAVAFNTVFVCVLHENPGTETGKTRGHLGSQLERKAETNLRLAKDGDGVTVVYAEKARMAHIPKEHGQRFTWSDEAKMHVSCAPEDDGASAKREELRTIAEQVFAENNGIGMSWEQLHKRIEIIEGCSRATARRRFDAMMRLNVLQKKRDEYWPK